MSRAQEAVAIIELATGNPVTAILHEELDELEVIDNEMAKIPEISDLFLAAADIEVETPITGGVGKVDSTGRFLLKSSGIDRKMHGRY